MRFARISANIERKAGRVDWCFEMDHVARVEVRGGTVQGEDLGAGCLAQELEDSVGAEVGLPDGDAARVQVGVGGVQGGEA